MSELSREEVEAAAKALWGHDWGLIPWDHATISGTAETYRVRVRAALEAAANVRTAAKDATISRLEAENAALKVAIANEREFRRSLTERLRRKDDDPGDSPGWIKWVVYLLPGHRLFSYADASGAVPKEAP